MVTVEELRQGTRNIVSTFMQASEAEREDGRTWYARAHSVACELSRRYGVNPDMVAAVIAALSPNNRWDRNVLDAERVLQAWSAGVGMGSVRVTTYNANLRKAWRILSGELQPEGPEGAFRESTGPKTLCFYRLIANPEAEDVCVDGHAYSIWSGQRMVLQDTKVRPGKQYQSIAEDYRQAGDFLGLKPSVVQATTWTVHRRIHLAGT